MRSQEGEYKYIIWKYSGTYKDYGRKEEGHGRTWGQSRDSNGFKTDVQQSNFISTCF